MGISAAMVYSATPDTLRESVQAHRAGSAAWITAGGIEYITRGKGAH